MSETSQQHPEQGDTYPVRMPEPAVTSPGPIFAIGGAEAKLRRRNVLRAFVAEAGDPRRGSR